MFKIVKLTLISLVICLTYNITGTTRLTVKNDTFKTLILYFDSVIYKRPQTETLLPKQTKSVFLDDYTDKDITKPITIEAHGGGSAGPVMWSFAQTDLRDNMVLIFSMPEQRPLMLTIIKPNGNSTVQDPIAR